MENSINSQSESDSYINSKERVFQKIHSYGINDQIFELVQRRYESALAEENIVLSRPERKRLFAEILKMVLDDMIKKIDKRSNSG